MNYIQRKWKYLSKQLIFYGNQRKHNKNVNKSNKLCELSGKEYVENVVRVGANDDPLDYVGHGEDQTLKKLAEPEVQVV